MTILEVKEFMKRIKSHYQEFVVDDFKTKEWYSELKKYDYEDVNNKLEQHLRNETYGESIPKLYFLTKYLIPTEQKGIKKEYNVYCPICGKYVNLEQYEDHYVKCNRTKLMVDDIKTYYNQNLDFDKIIKLSDESYEKLYKKYLNMMLDADIPYYRKNLILKILYPDTELNVKDVISNIGG